jgi:hypothetical protein
MLYIKEMKEDDDVVGEVDKANAEFYHALKAYRWK